jgi:A/G-specific adenine glycosylase
MLQQTRVDTVVPYYERFLARWPNVASLAAADPDDVRASWSGLGYYRRAKLMLEAAHSIVRDHGGEFPREHEQIAKLPGFGPYTAGAVASIAFDTPEPAVDGNVQRVLARAFGVEGDVTKGAANREIWDQARALAEGEATGDLNQGLIELGALLCTPKSPRCEECPISADCRARKDRSVERIPPPRKRAAKKTIEVTALLWIDDRSVLLERQPKDGLFADLWCLPLLEGRLEPEAIRDEALRKYDWDVDAIDPAGELQHVLTHRDLFMRIARVAGDPPAELRLARVDRLEELAVPAVTARALRVGLPPALLAIARLPGRSSGTLSRVERRRRHR